MGTGNALRHLARLAGAGLAAVLLGACAALPEVDYLDTRLQAPATPTVAGPPAQAQAERHRLSSAWRTSVAAKAAVEEAATGSPLIAGNKVELLYDGPQTMAAMMAAIREAKSHVNLETYIFDQDALGQQFANLLMERRRAGVQVNVIYDGVGTLETPRAFFDAMRNAGIRLLAFNPVGPQTVLAPGRANHRDHRKLLVVDGRVAFTGGINISVDYASSSLFRARGASGGGKPGWRDTHLRIEGPAVAALQAAFLDTWAQLSKDDPGGAPFFPAPKAVGDKAVRVLASEPGGDFDIYKAYVLAIQQARQSVHITSAYFVPDRQILQALTDAARRGVDVKLVLPGVSDIGLVLYAARSFYADMLAAGIQIYQMKVTVLHAKTAVIDGNWATVGSTNIDTRSFLHNNELNVVVLGEGFGAAMESAFAEDLRHCERITPDQWAARPAGDKFKEWLARRFEYML